MNIENSKTNESDNFFHEFTDKLNLKTQINILHWLIQVFMIYGKTLNLHITTIHLTFRLQLGIMNLICLMDPILF